MTSNAIQQRLTACGIPCDAALAERLATYMRLLAEWNQVMDLTAVTEEDETLDRHFADSLAALTVPGLIPQTGALADVGTGAGFPGLPLAMACPELRVTLIDAQRKRLDFLQAVVEATGTRNVTLLHLRAEDAGHDAALRQRFDRVAARAVAPLNVLSEYLLPLTKMGGMALCWKGPALGDELDAGRRATRILGGEALEPIPVNLPGRDWGHVLLPIRKIGPTAKAYPRKAGTPSKKPLGAAE